MRLHTSAFVAALVLAGCVPSRITYVPESSSSTMGYAEEWLKGDRYRVSYSAPKQVPIYQVEQFALRRTAEFALESGFSSIAIVHRSVERVYVLHQRDGSRVTYRGGMDQWLRFWRLYCLGRGWHHCNENPLWASHTRPVVRVEVSFTVDIDGKSGGRSDFIDAAYLLVLLNRYGPDK